MNLKSALIKLYFLLVHADGEVNEREEALGIQMIKTEGISEAEFISVLELLKKRTTSNIYAESIEELKRLDHQRQIRCVAWLCVVANADGFMDKTEWQFIYMVYHKELGLNLEEVMKVQKELVGLTFKKPMSFISVL
ncbi:MAG: TerB family tellurite resistance protein [Bacteroidetes bacterium]|nr:TerB family tellurite resistance protein [Bacteroidota bacterium]MBI3481770.1 TerB family tellurite resistance protein [Bacteroidota bacterium]